MASKVSALQIGSRHYLGSRTSSSGAQQIVEDVILPVPVPVQGLILAVCLPFASPRLHLYQDRVQELNMSQEQSLSSCSSDGSKRGALKPVPANARHHIEQSSCMPRTNAGRWSKYKICQGDEVLRLQARAERLTMLACCQTFNMGAAAAAT